MAIVIRTKRAYDPPAESDGFRVLVDRLWPRGIKKEDLKVDLWLKEVSPSETLRKWFGHDPERWEEFKSHYFEELRGKEGIIDKLLPEGIKTVTLVYASKEERYNNAVALREYLENEKPEAVAKAA